MNIIIHAGGSIEGHTYTNSIEAIEKNTSLFNDFVMCEIDCCKTKDGYLFVHDSLEKYYNIENKFNELSNKVIKSYKYNNKFKIPDFNDLKNIIINKPYINFIIDSKHDLSDDFINYAKNELNDKINNIIFQVYNYNDIEMIKKHNLKCLYALWKYNNCAYNDNIKKCIDFINNENINCVGISLFSHFLELSDQVDKLKNSNKKIYIHGESDYIKCINILNKGFGIFSHYPEKFISYNKN